MYAKNIRASVKREVQTERSATFESRALNDENVPAKRTDF